MGGRILAGGNWADVWVACMSDELKNRPSTGELVRNSLLYRHFQAQRDEIMRHKWLESEKAGHDIGFDRAHADWTIKHSAQWQRERSRREQEPASPGRSRDKSASGG